MKIICRKTNRRSLSSYLESNQLQLEISHDYHEYCDGEWWKMKVGDVEVGGDDFDGCLVELVWELSDTCLVVDCTEAEKEAVMEAVLEAGLL